MKKVNYTLINHEGIHIGTAYNQYEKGKIDSYTIKDYNGYPYIPATSIKGKVRYFLDNLELFNPSQQLVDSINEDILKSDKNNFKKISNVLFGSHESEENNFEFNTMKKIMFKDAKLTTSFETASELYEIKAENSIDIDNDVYQVVSNPRIIERTIPDLEYKFEIIIIGFEEEETILNLFDFVFECITDYGYIGGNGTRGYGQVTIKRGA